MRYVGLSTLEQREKLLPWQAAGRSYTATGYGRKIPTSLMVKHDGRWKRVYCCIFSNIGTCYVISGGEWVVVREHE